MKRKLIIFGTEKLGRRLKRLIDDSDQYEVSSFSIDRSFCDESTLDGVEVVPWEDICDVLPPAEYDILFAIGYTKMNSVRKRHMEQALDWGYGIASYVHPTATVLTDNIGTGNIFLENVTIGDNVRIGNGNIFFPVSHIAHDSVIGDYNFFTVSCVVSGEVIVGNECFFGANSTVKNGIRIADKTLIGAAAYISNNTDPDSVYVPARSYKIDKNPQELI